MKYLPPDLTGWHVVILRPRQQAQPFVQMIQALHATPLLLPTLEIIPLEITSAKVQEWTLHLNHTAVIIVASANAVTCAPLPFLQALQEQCAKLQIITMGKATSAALNDHSIPLFWTPPPGSTSESLLNQPILQAGAIAGKTVLLLAGEGGRTYLQDQLTQRGAKVINIKVYRQALPEQDIRQPLTGFQQLAKCCFVATSVNMLENLIQLADPTQAHWVLSRPMIVVSERTAQHAQMRGAQQVFIAQSAHPEDIQIALQKMAQVCDTMG